MGGSDAIDGGSDATQAAVKSKASSSTFSFLLLLPLLVIRP